MIKILVADDHAIVRAGLKQFVSDATDIMVADEASTGDEALNKALENNYDVVLLDITMPGINGLDILKQLSVRKPEVRVLVLTMHPEDEYAIRVLKAGAAGYLTKESAPQELIMAIRKVASGGRYISAAFAEKLLYDFGPAIEKDLHQSLSDREFQIMYMIVSGKRLNDIAKELVLSVKTVSSYRSRILHKLKLKSNAELVRYAVDHRLVQ